MRDCTSSNCFVCFSQEGVAENIYFPKTVEVELADGGTLQCRVYQRAVDPSLVNPGNDLTPDKPSLLYKETILQGAVESNLPNAYVEKLKDISHNGYQGQAQMGHVLNIM